MFGKEKCPTKLKYVIRACMLLLVKCYDNKIVTLPGGSFYRSSYMQLTNFRDDAPRYDDGLTGDSMSFR